VGAGGFAGGGVAAREWVALAALAADVADVAGAGVVRKDYSPSVP
jgi:hypothetical protein